MMRSGGTPNLASTAASSSVSLRHGIDQRDMRIDQLRHVLVAGRNDCSACSRVRPVSPACRSHHPPPRLPRSASASPLHDALMQRLDLRRQIVRHGRAVRLVLRIQVVAESLAFCIEYAGAIMGLVILVQTAQHVEHAVNRRRSVRCCGCANPAAHEKRDTGKMNRQPATMFSFKTSKGFQMSAEDKLAHTMTNDFREKTWSASESWRVFGIMAEFVEATERLTSIRPAVSIFGSARTLPDHPIL